MARPSGGIGMGWMTPGKAEMVHLITVKSEAGGGRGMPERLDSLMAATTGKLLFKDLLVAPFLGFLAVFGGFRRSGDKPQSDEQDQAWISPHYAGFMYCRDGMLTPAQGLAACLARQPQSGSIECALLP